MNEKHFSRLNEELKLKYLNFVNKELIEDITLRVNRVIKFIKASQTSSRVSWIKVLIWHPGDVRLKPINGTYPNLPNPQINQLQSREVTSNEFVIMYSL